MRLTEIDTTKTYFAPGTAVRLRPVAVWAGFDDGTRPIACEYVEDGGGFRVIYWSAELDKCLDRGQEFRIIHNPAQSPLPFCSPADRFDGQGWHLHPDWIEPVESTADPAGEPCRCDLFSVVMVIGCQCGRMQRERALVCRS